MNDTTPTPGFDLNDFDNITSAECAITHPLNGQPTGNTVTLAGPEHPVRQKFLLDRSRALRAQVRKTGKLEVTDPADEHDSETDFLIVCTLGWQLTAGGQPLAFSADAARALYIDARRQWLRAQLVAALEQTDLFIRGSSAS